MGLLLHHGVETLLMMSCWGDHRGHAAGGLRDRLLNIGKRLQLLEEGFQLFHSERAKSLFPSAQDEFDPYFVSFFEKLFREGLPQVPIVRAHLKGDANALHVNALLLLPTLPLTLVVVVLVFAIVEQAAHRGSGSRVYLYEVEARDPSLSEGFVARHDADLLAVRPNKAHFTRADPLVYAWVVLCAETASPPSKKKGAEARTLRNGGWVSRMRLKSSVRWGYRACQ